MRSWDRREDRSPARGDDGQNRPPGVVDTLGLGFAAVVARPFVIVPLLVLDLILLFLPAMTIAPVTREIADAARSQGRGWDNVARDVERGRNYNVIDLSAVQIPMMRTPALMSSVSAERRWSYTWSTVESGTPIWLLAGLAATAVAAGVLVASIFRVLLAHAAAGSGRLTAAVTPAVVGSVALALAGWAVIVFGMLVLVAMPAVVVSGLGAAAGYPEASIVWILVLLPIGWGYVHFFFSVPALTLERRGAMQSLRASHRVVRQFFWQTIQFIAVSLLMTTGLTFALREMATSAGGALLAVCINAFVASGLIVAAMLFYRDRASRLDPATVVPAIPGK